MKKTILIILLSTICFLSGCKLQENESKAESNEKDMSGLEDNISYLIIEYMTFDEILTYCTDVVVATYENTVKDEGRTYNIHNFTINERLTGTDEGEKLSVHELLCYTEIEGKDNLSHNTLDVKYTKGNKYLLLLEKRTSVYLEKDRYLPVANSMFLPMDNIENSTLYRQPLKEHIVDKTILSQFKSNDINEKSLKNYIYEKTKNNPIVLGNDYIRSDKMVDIVKGSEFILKVKIGQHQSGATSKDRELYLCEIIDIFKGDLDTDELINIIFISETVKQGNEYIVAIDTIDKDNLIIFQLSSKNSVFKISQESEIRSLLK